MQASCKVLGCDENHSKHYCRLCENNDSDHFARKCPKGVLLYHGTKVDCLSSISKTGLRASVWGRIGKGVYFANKKIA